MKCIVTTTIYKPSEAVIKFCNKPGWQFIIVGDLKTPHDEYIKLTNEYKNVKYLTPEYQAVAYSEISNLIGWNTIQRRNIGFIEAFRMGADVIASVDDDNIPYDSWGKNLYVNKEIEVDCYEPVVNVFDPLSVTKYKHLWHRGFPLEYLRDKNDIQYKGKIKRKVLVQADLWDGDPDIDAMARLTFNPTVQFTDITKPYCSNMMSPFNSQNTFLSRKVIPFYAVLPFVGRMDDIWAAYILQYHFPESVIYCPATVYQARNKQDLITNLQNELIGYRNTEKLVRDMLYYEEILPQNTYEFYKSYIKQFDNRA